MERAKSDPATLLLVGAEFAAMALPESLRTTRGREIRAGVCADGASALALLTESAVPGRARPGLVLMDLEAAGPGLSVLQEFKGHALLGCLPVTIVLPSTADGDAVRDVYRRRANCCVCDGTSDSLSADTLARLLDFWFDVATLPAVGCAGG